MSICKECRDREAEPHGKCFRCKWDEEDARGVIRKKLTKERAYSKPMSVKAEREFTKQNRIKIRKELREYL